MWLVSKSCGWALAGAVLGIMLSGPVSAQSCKYTVKRTVKQTAGESNPKCQVTCSGAVKIQLASKGTGNGPIEGVENREIALNFAANEPLGGEENALCTSNGAVNWGDSDQDEPFPSTDWNDCAGHIGTRIAAVDSYTPEVIMKHTYRKAGTYCVSVKMFAGRQDRHGEACAYDCTLENSVHVKIKPEAGASDKTRK